MNTTTEQKFKSYQQLAAHLFNEMELKVQTVEILNPEEYGRHAIYITRIGNCGYPKFRVINTGSEHVRNCLKLTYNPDRWSKEYLIQLVNSRKALLARFCHGSCHSFINHDILKQVLTGVCYGCTQEKAKFQAMLG